MKNKIVIGLLVVLIIIGGLVYYFGFWQKEKMVEEIKEEVEEIKEEIIGEGIISAWLESSPAGIPIAELPREGKKTTIFKKDDLIRLSGEFQYDGKVILSYQIFNKKGEMVQDKTSLMELEGEEGTIGGFGACCLISPREVGEYIVKLFLNDKEEKTLSFEIVE